MLNMFARIRKLFMPKPEPELNLLDIFKPMYRVLAVHGLFPYTVKFKNNNKCVIIHQSIHISSVCAASLNLIIIAFMIIHTRGIVNRSVKDSLSDIITTEINYIIELLIFAVFCLVTYYSAFINRFNYVHILNTLSTAWAIIPNNHGDILKKLKQKVSVTLLSLVFLLIIQLAVNFTRHDKLWKQILVIFSFIIPQMLQFICLGFYYVLLLMVIALLMKIEEQLKAIYIDWRIVTQCFTKTSSSVLIASSGIYAMELAFIKVCEVTRDINKAFQASILTTTMQCFHAMVSESYIIYHGAVQNQTLNTHEVINCSIWIAYQILKIYVLSHTGNLFKIEIFRIGQTLHNIPIAKRDITTFLEIQHFSNVITYQATDLTVYGYFPLDATLSFKMIASAAMYLVILVQFDKT